MCLATKIYDQHTHTHLVCGGSPGIPRASPAPFLGNGCGDNSLRWRGDNVTGSVWGSNPDTLLLCNLTPKHLAPRHPNTLTPCAMSSCTQDGTLLALRRQSQSDALTFISIILHLSFCSVRFPGLAKSQHNNAMPQAEQQLTESSSKDQPPETSHLSTLEHMPLPPNSNSTLRLFLRPHTLSAVQVNPIRRCPILFLMPCQLSMCGM